MTASVNNGQLWQRTLDIMHDRYRAANPSRAIVHPQAPPVRVLTRPDRFGRFEACFKAYGPPDYMGAVRRDGREPLPVVFDAKSTIKGHWSFDLLEAHQAQDLEGHTLMGAFAFLAIRTSVGCWVLPWAAFGATWWGWSDVRGTRSHKASAATRDLDAWGTRMTADGDWLAALGYTS